MTDMLETICECVIYELFNALNIFLKHNFLYLMLKKSQQASLIERGILINNFKAKWLTGSCINVLSMEGYTNYISVSCFMRVNIVKLNNYSSKLLPMSDDNILEHYPIFRTTCFCSLKNVWDFVDWLHEMILLPMTL